MPDNTARKQAYFFACLAAITTIGGAVGSYEYRELKEAYRAEQARSIALAARLQEVMAARDSEQDEDQATGSSGETAVAAIKKHSPSATTIPTTSRASKGDRGSDRSR
ncbi:hypothetical protein [Desulfovibrio sp.]|uniref:hypothetical protein n=1 Tax=Desulfovibrio sp. TaxID=885 RepID=UPI003077753F